MAAENAVSEEELFTH